VSIRKPLPTERQDWPRAFLTTQTTQLIITRDLRVEAAAVEKGNGEWADSRSSAAENGFKIYEEIVRPLMNEQLPPAKRDG